MSDPSRPAPKSAKSLPVLPEGQVYCRRLKQALPVAEHHECNYCFGTEAEIATGEHEKFCDFDPKKDPINFGFPDGGGWVGER